MIKKLLILLFFTFSFSLFTYCSAQTYNADSLTQRVIAEKSDSIKLNELYTDNLTISDVDPAAHLKMAHKLLLLAQKNNDKVCEAFALVIIGYDSRVIGDNVRALDYTLKAIKTANETHNERLIAYTTFFHGHVYLNQKDYHKAIMLYTEAKNSFEKVKDYTMLRMAYEGLSQSYLLQNKIDSALFCSQRAYELINQYHITGLLGHSFGQLAIIQAKLGNTTLALSYYNMALTESYKAKSAKQLNYVYTYLAQFYADLHQTDSSMMYAKKAIAAVENTAMSNSSLTAAKLLADMYRHANADSALKYTDMYMAAKDSLYSERAIQQTQAMTFEDELHQQELANEKAQADEQRKENIQYALIAFGIVVLIMLFLLLSRSIITNTRLIQLLSVMALLIVFEFLNLLLHPFLERITHHTPILMLLGLVCIAALLVPLHHRIEHWATNRLIEKNKEIRLAAAKKTIEKLEKDKTN